MKSGHISIEGCSSPQKKKSSKHLVKKNSFDLTEDDSQSKNVFSSEKLSSSDNLSDDGSGIYSNEYENVGHVLAGPDNLNPKYWKTWDQMTPQERVDCIFPPETQSAKDRADRELDQYQELYQHALQNILQSQNAKMTQGL